MAKLLNFAGLMREAGKASVTASLCAVMVAGPLLAEQPMAKAPVGLKLTEEQKALHALNRFTFGPRQGDVAAVEKMGLKAWFERQLNPGSIDDANLNAMLARFPAMQLSPQALMQKFPSPQMFRQMARQHTPLPSDPVENAIYANGMAQYERQQALQAAQGAKKPVQGADADGMSPAMAAADAAAMNDPAAASTDALTPVAKVRKRGPRAAYAGESVEAILALPPQERLMKILAIPPDQLASFRQELRPMERGQLVAGMNPEQAEILAALQGPVRVVGAETLESRLLRDVYSDRQLEAVMTDFWLNHFNVYVRKNAQEPYLLSSYERDTIRPRALGKFEDLLVATAESPAMLMYLDNWQSIGPNSMAATRGARFARFAPNSQLAQAMPKGINENYARELIELHTIGVRCEVSADHTVKQLEPSCGSGYTQADVTNFAKVLTGWTIDRPYQGGGGGFTFDERRHEGGSKQVLGVTIREDGAKEALQVLHMLATSPATAAFISHKLAVRFVSDDPPKAVEDRMAKTFLASGGDMKAVLRTMFDSPEFWSPTVYRAKVKTPLEFVASALRASDAQVVNAMPLVQAMDRLGMPLYGMQTPNGYSWLADEWVSTTALVSRMNFAMVMSGGVLPGTRTDWAKLLGDPSVDGAKAPSLKTEKALEMALLGAPAVEKTTTAVMEHADRPGQVEAASKGLALGPAAGGNDEDGAAMLVGAKGGKKRGYAGVGLSMTDLASSAEDEGPVVAMAGLLLGSPDFQRR